jgi:hypothetical protein
MDLLARLKRFRSTRFLRKVLAWEFDVRDVAARLLTPPPPNRPEDWSLLNISPFRKPHFRRARSSSAIVREGDHTCQTGVDRATVITGSFNFTKAAEERNAENILILKSSELSKIYVENWLSHRDHSDAYLSAVNRVQSSN